jgi:Transposase IS4
MIDEQEIPGASDRAEDAPSLYASRTSERPKKPTQRWTESQLQRTPPKPPPRSHKRKREIPIYNDGDLATLPLTQNETQPSQGTVQEGPQRTSRQKKRKKSTKKSSQNESTLELWEQEFNAVNSSDKKLQVLLTYIGHEAFPEALHIPQRPPEILLDEEIDPLKPLDLWYRFVSPEILQVIANNTNENESLLYETREHSRRERTWHDLNGADIGAYIGAVMLMGIHPQSKLEDYWNTSEDKPTFPLQTEMSRERFQQISRYFKVNSPHEVLDDDHFYAKVEPLMSSFREAAQKLVKLPDTVAIDENLIAAQTRSKHLIQIDNKVASKGYKIYCLASGHYLWDWIYTSKAAKVPQARQYHPSDVNSPPFTDTELMVLTLIDDLRKAHPDSKFTVVFDNFFTTDKLFKELREWGVGAYGTAKAGSGMPKPHIRMREVASKEKNYGEMINTTGQGINFVSFVDKKVVWMMSTVHDVANQPSCWRSTLDRSKVSHHLARETVDGGLEIPYPQLSEDYNNNMGSCDLCQQIWDAYPLSKHRHRRNWWALFWMIIHASIGNALFIYRHRGFKSLTHQELQQRIGLQLLRNPASVNRKRDIEKPSIKRLSLLRRPSDEHEWERISRRNCAVCKPPRSTQLRGPARPALQEIDYNTRQRRRKRQRGPQTTYGCKQCQAALCYNSECWRKLHSRDSDSDTETNQENVSQSE